jgi:hypothetical protein
MSARNRQNWSTVRMRNVMRRQGRESKRVEVPFMAPLLPEKPQPARGPSKAEMRTEAAAALEQWRQKQNPGGFDDSSS